jgi:hypothetical protein
LRWGLRETARKRCKSLILRYTRAHADDQRCDRLGNPRESDADVSAVRFSVAFVLTGMALILWSMVEKPPLMAVVGVADGALFWPAVKFADKIRRSNIMFRTLEVPLNLANTATEAAEMLQPRNGI